MDDAETSASAFTGPLLVGAAAEAPRRRGLGSGRSARAADTGELDNLTGLSITPAVDAGSVRVTVSARTVSLLPGVPGPTVSQTAAGAIERFTTGGDR